MKNAMRLILAGMLCTMLAAQEPENQEPEKEEVEDYLEKCDANEEWHDHLCRGPGLWTRDSHHEGSPRLPVHERPRR